MGRAFALGEDERASHSLGALSGPPRPGSVTIPSSSTSPHVFPGVSAGNTVQHLYDMITGGPTILGDISDPLLTTPPTRPGKSKPPMSATPLSFIAVYSMRNRFRNFGAFFGSLVVVSIAGGVDLQY